MAVLHIYQNIASSTLGGNITIKTAGQIQIVAGTVTLDYFGHSFTYQGDYILSGTLTGITLSDSANGGLQYDISGLLHNIVLVFEYLGHGNLNGYLAYLFSGDDTIIGTSEDDVLTGWTGHDAIFGGAGNDTLADESNGNTFYGGLGDDVYLIGGLLNGSGTIVELAGEGTDWLFITGSGELAPNVENLKMVDGPTSTSDYGYGYHWTARGNASGNILLANGYDNLLEGLDGNDSLDGAGGNDTLDGGSGADTLNGGEGDDVYIVDGPADVILDTGGNDSIVPPYDGYVLADPRIENLRLGDGAQRYAGSPNAESIVGNALANSIAGGAGNDTLQGADGADTLDGGPGADLMDGGDGVDTYFIDNPGDVVDDTGGGYYGDDDIVFSTVTYDMGNSPGLTGIILLGSANIDASGSWVSNLIVGNDGNNVLTAGEHGGILRGGQGDDTLVGSPDPDTLDGDAGIDTVAYADPKDYYQISRNAGTVLVKRNGYTDVLVGVDSLVFPDGSLVLNTQQAAGTVSIEGTQMQTWTLTATASGLSDGNGLGTGALTYQWFRGAVELEGQTQASHVLSAADVGQTVRVRIRFVDGAGNTESLWSQPTASIVARDLTAPTAVSWSPADDATGVAVTQSVAVTFSESIARGVGEIVLKRADGTVVEAFNAATSNRLSISGSTLTIDPLTDLSHHSSYTIEFAPGSVNDLSGNGFSPVTGYTFTTAPYTAGGTAGDDSITGSATDDVLEGLAGDDTLIGGDGDDTLNGGTGVDTALMDAPGLGRFSWSGSELHVTTADGSDVLVGIERLRLTYTLYACDTHEGESAWNANALLWAALGMAPDRDLFSQWVREADGVESMTQLARNMLDQYAPGMSSESLVTHLYGTLLGLVPSASDVAFFADRIGAGKAWSSNSDFLAFAASHDINTDRMVGFVGNLAGLDPADFG